MKCSRKCVSDGMAAYTVSEVKFVLGAEGFLRLLMRESTPDLVLDFSADEQEGESSGSATPGASPSPPPAPPQKNKKKEKKQKKGKKDKDRKNKYKCRCVDHRRRDWDRTVTE